MLLFVGYCAATNHKSQFINHKSEHESVEAAEIDRDEFAYTGFLHGDTVNYVYRAHGLFVMCYNDELAVFAELIDHVCEFANVGVIQGRIHFIEDTERCGLDQVDGKKKGCGSERFFATT